METIENIQDITGKYSLNNIFNLLLTDQFDLYKIKTVHGFIKQSNYKKVTKKEYFIYSVKFILINNKNKKFMEYNIKNKREINFVYFRKKITKKRIVQFALLANLLEDEYNDKIICENNRILFL